MTRRLALVHPRYWHVWLLLVPLTVVAACIPWPLQRWLGILLGDLTWWLLPRRRHITLRNLALCFPAESPEWRSKVARESFRSTGVALFESGQAWWRSPASLYRRFEVRGIEHIEAARARGRGVLLLGAHYTTLEIVGAAMSTVLAPLDTIYRPQNNPALEAFVRWRRRRIYARQIDRRDIRAVFRALKDNHVVWYTGDQDFGVKHAVFAPFFGEPAATVTAGSRFAKANDSVAIAIDFRRDDRTGRYVVELSPPLAGYGSRGEEQDARQMNAHIEYGIRKAPGQYMWFHRRFKSRLPSMPPIY